jgi:hypothetical protein
MIEIVLKDDSGGSGVDLYLARSPRPLADSEPRLSLMTCESFILQNYWNSDARAKRFSKLFDRRCQGRRRAVEPSWPPYDDCRESILGCGKRLDFTHHHIDCCTV